MPSRTNNNFLVGKIADTFVPLIGVSTFGLGKKIGQKLDDAEYNKNYESFQRSTTQTIQNYMEQTTLLVMTFFADIILGFLITFGCISCNF